MISPKALSRVYAVIAQEPAEARPVLAWLVAQRFGAEALIVREYERSRRQSNRRRVPDTLVPDRGVPDTLCPGPIVPDKDATRVPDTYVPDKVPPGPPSKPPNLVISRHKAVEATAVEVLNFLNERTGHSYRRVDANLRLIEARLLSGASLSDCRCVITAKIRQWGTNPDMRSYLRPATLFAAKNFEQYLGEITAYQQPQNGQRPDA